MRDKRLRQIIHHYGLRLQLKQLVEEVYELIEAIYIYECQSLNCFATQEYVLEEYADVQVMLNQIKDYYLLNDKDINEIMDFKINRQLERIAKENEL